MAEVPTVRVVNPSSPDEFLVINESDYDAAEHTLWEDRTEAVDATPSAEALAVEHGIDLAEVEGTGKGGRVLKSDVAALVEDEE